VFKLFIFTVVKTEKYCFEQNASMLFKLHEVC